MKSNSIKLFTLVIFLIAARAFAQTTPTTIVAATNLPATVAAGTVSNQTSWVYIPQNGVKGLALRWLFNASSGTAAGTIFISPSVDGISTATNQIWVLTQAAGGTVTNCVSTNWSPAQLTGFQFLNIWGMTNAGGGGTLTNGGIVISRPN